MMLEVGKLYSCLGHRLYNNAAITLLIYPDKACAVESAVPHAPVGAEPPDAGYWSKRFGKPIGYCEPQTPLLVLIKEEKYVRVLAGDYLGWIICEDWITFNELADQVA